MFYFHLYLWKMFNLTNIFQKGWNHQPDSLCRNFFVDGETKTHSNMFYSSSFLGSATLDES